MLKEIEKTAKKFKNVDEVKQELKRVQSVKCRLKKQKERKDYELEMTKILKTEQLLKEVKTYFEPIQKFITDYDETDISKLTFDETVKAVKSIQSKKCNSQYESDKTEYKKACKIEKMLLEHKSKVKPIPETTISKMTVQNVIEQLESLDQKIDKEYVLELLQNLSK